MNHPNIVLIYDYNINPLSGRSYIIMEYVSGPSLRTRIEDRVDNDLPLSLEDIAEDLYYCSQLCDALGATHRKGIIHRDIKPDNILINSRNQVKITDFGIMHMEQATVTPTGALVGTPRYMSPEQVQGVRVDPRSDIYSIGIILYELMVGAPPFVSGDISYQQVNISPTPPREIVEIIPPVVNTLILKCLEKRPTDRPQTTGMLKLEIERVLDGALANYVEAARLDRETTAEET